MSQSFKADGDFNSSHKMGQAGGSVDKMHKVLGEPTEIDGDKCAFVWEGEFTANDGTTHRASVWDWKNSLVDGHYASVWIKDQMYLAEFIAFIEK